MKNRILAGLSAVAIIAAGIIAVQPSMPPMTPGPRSVRLALIVDADKADEAWPAWARAWCHDGDALCVDANDDPQGVPQCIDGVVVGYLAKTRATRAQADRAAFTLRDLGVVLEGDATSAVEDLGWVTCETTP